jgi:hypothetical protein
MQSQPYTELLGFENLYLEDSYVIAILQEATELRFLLDVVLLEGHPLYQQPRPEEQYCYRRARLVFPNVRDVIWHRQELRGYTDATGTVDYGNIDSFRWWGGEYHLEGDWGSLTVRSDPPYVDFDPES